MLLSQLVEINEKGIVASSVNFSMMDDQEMNLNLCEGFIFNYEPKKPELSTVGILDLLRRSYHSRNEPNIHLMIQQYGKGKSHFAVAIANFFKKTIDSPEVQGILHQVEMATSSGSKAIAEGLRLYKQQRHKHLVICLSGDRGGDIRKQFLQVLLKSLESEGIKDSLAQHTCSEPLRYLENLDTGHRAIAEEYLESIGNPDGDLNCLIGLLKENNPGVIPTVKNLARHLTGFTPDFSANIDIEAILKDLLDNLCAGDNPRFQGILILFDELNYYLQSWAADSFGAGGTALQNITNICETFKGKIALLSFTQIHPSSAIGISATAKESYLKLSSRLGPKDSTYNEPVSSLELVLDNLLIQKEDTPDWKEFRSHWDNTLLSEARTAYEQRIKIYSQKGWSFDQFHRHLSKGCFPLHPLTAYLLCNLDFTQDRTAIQFIKGYVKNYIQAQPVEQANHLNYIYPIALVDTFVENFSNYSVYTRYKEAYNTVVGSDAPDELAVLKAVFLFYASGEKLTKPDREEHEEILLTLTGLPKSKLKAALDKLAKTRDLVYYRPETKLYRFWEGPNPTGIEEEIEDQIKDTPTFLNSIVFHCQSKIKKYLGDETTTAIQFVKDNKLVGADWRFEYKIYSIDGFIKALSSDQTLRGTTEKGILAYVLAETQEELQNFRRSVDEHLSQSPLKSQIAVAIPTEETGDLARVLLKIKTLENKQPTERRLLGTAYEQLFQRWEEQVNKQIENLLSSCTYHCVAIEKIPPAERIKPQRVISSLLQDLYPFVPPVDEIDKMRSDHQTGSKIVRLVAQQLLAESLTPQTLQPLESYYSDVIDKIFVNRWGLLRKASQKYIVQEPIHEKIRAAWDLISQMTALEGLPEKIVDLQKIWKALSGHPYGYTEYTFTILLAGWLAYHRKEVALRGAVTVSSRQGVSVTVQTQSLKNLANTDILQKPTVFVNHWIIQGKAKLIRHKKLELPVLPPSPIDYDRAQQYLGAVTAFLESNEPDPVEVGEVTKNRERVVVGIEQIGAWFKPVEEAEALPDVPPLEVLLPLYPQLLQRPPAIDLRADVISVKPSEQQRDRKTQALHVVGEQIEQRVVAKSVGSEALPTEEACSAYKAEIEQLVYQLDRVPSLPPHLIDILRNSLQVADRTRVKIKEQARIEQCLLQIQRLNRDLNYDSTQQDYTRTRAEIEALQESIPNGRESVEIQQILQDLDQRYKDFTQKIEMWEERSSGVTSPNQILELIKEIHSQLRRFTESASERRISALQSHLEKELLRIQDKNDGEKLVRAELATAQQKLQRIRDLPVTKLSEAFLVYQELVSSSLPSTDQASLGEYREKLEGFKTQGYTVISEKFAQIYNRKPNRLEDCESLKDLVHKSINLLADAEEYTDIQASMERAVQSLEVQQQELQRQLEERQKEAQDRQVMQAIYQFKSGNINTLELCANGVKEIEKLREQIIAPNQFTDEIDQILQLLRDKVATYQRSLLGLRERLTKVNNLTDLERIHIECAKLDFVFKDSADYPAYHELQERIQLLRNDLERVQSLEVSCQQSDSIASCNDVLEMIIKEQTVIHDLGRFRERISKIEDSLRRKIRMYIQELREFEQKLDNLTTARGAQELQEQFLKKSMRYSSSDAEEEYAAISNEIKHSIELLQMAESVNVNNLQSCQIQLDKLTQWNTTEITSKMRDRVDSLCAELEHSIAQVLQRQKAAAEEWGKDLGNQCAQIYRLTDNTEKLEIANKILKEIQAQTQYIELLSPMQQQSLEYIERQCNEEQGKHKANQILVLFRQLPRLQRQSLYENLAAYLPAATEEFNG